MAIGLCMELVSGLQISPSSNNPWVSQSENEIDDKGSEDVNLYANLAIKDYNEDEEANFVLVKVCCVATGSIPGGHVVHMNLEAIRTDVPDASLETFFVEFDVVNNDVEIGYMTPLGPTSSLPDKAEVYGCVYCLKKKIHHPDEIDFRTGREHLYPELLQKIQMMKNDVNGMKAKYKGSSLADRCAKLALDKYNEEKGENFVLVETNGLGGASHIIPGFLMHLNFDAKKEDDPELITFFAEAIKFDKDAILVTFCKCLGPTNELPLEECELCGCEYCLEDEDTIHPECGGYMNGRGKWEYDLLEEYMTS